MVLVETVGNDVGGVDLEDDLLAVELVGAGEDDLVAAGEGGDEVVQTVTLVVAGAHVVAEDLANQTVLETDDDGTGRLLTVFDVGVLEIDRSGGGIREACRSCRGTWCS